MSIAAPSLVIPAKAGSQGVERHRNSHWVPAFAGMTNLIEKVV